jgi:OmpA-OmpF porin, OOP family
MSKNPSKYCAETQSGSIFGLTGSRQMWQPAECDLAGRHSPKNIHRKNSITMRKLLLALFASLPILLGAQKSNPTAELPHPWDIGGGIGLSTYEGDISSAARVNESLNKIKPGISLHLRRNVNNNFAARLQLLGTSLAGDDRDFTDKPWRDTRGISFSSTLVELAISGELYPFGLYKKSDRKQRRAVAPFVSLGIGGAFFNPKVNWNDANGNEEINPALSQLDKDANQKFSLSLPVGGGIRFRLTDRFTLGLEGALRATLNDYLDGVSEAGNPEAGDWFFNAQIAASYSFGTPSKKRDRDNLGGKPDGVRDQIDTADNDGDGIANEKDDCPDQPGPRSLKGCPDADRDGVADNKDQCPDQPGSLKLFGCPDADGDGIADKDDGCPNVAGVAAYRGCPPVDRDKDGVADGEDLCPDMVGELKWKGCPDSDGDGIADNKDDCPGIAGPDALAGCPDTDGDGIADKDDECPTSAGTAAKKGCPDAAPPAPGVPYKAVFFGSTLQDWYGTSSATLDEVVAILNGDPSLYARVEGHTDNTGEEPANSLLSEQRAKKCFDYLVAKGISNKRLSYAGFGSARPSNLNSTKEGRQLNRRVEVHFYKK